MQTVALSESAVAVLRFEIKGWRAKNRASRLPAYRELAAAGIMELVPGSEMEYRFTPAGLEHRQAILEREADRIERERFEPPETSDLSESARALLRRHLAGYDEVTDANRSAYRGVGRRADHDPTIRVRHRAGSSICLYLLGLAYSF